MKHNKENSAQSVSANIKHFARTRYKKDISDSLKRKNYLEYLKYDRQVESTTYIA